MNNQPMKRRNPFDRPINNVEKEEEKVIEEVVEEETADEEEYVEPIKTVVAPKQTVKPVQKTTKVTKSKYNEVTDESREKFTSTMDVNLRRRIKIVCATRGIMFSEFIEEACRDKLRREGE